MPGRHRRFIAQPPGPLEMASAARNGSCPARGALRLIDFQDSRSVVASIKEFVVGDRNLHVRPLIVCIIARSQGSWTFYTLVRHYVVFNVGSNKKGRSGERPHQFESVRFSIIGFEPQRWLHRPHFHLLQSGRRHGCAPDHLRSLHRFLVRICQMWPCHWRRRQYSE